MGSLLMVAEELPLLRWDRDLYAVPALVGRLKKA